MYIAFAVMPGLYVRRICKRQSPTTALQYARTKLRDGESVSINREGVPIPSIRASETFAGVGDPMTKEEASKRMGSWHSANLAAARAKKRETHEFYEEENFWQEEY